MEKTFSQSKPLDWIVDELDVEAIPKDQISYGGVDVFEDRIGRRLRVPVITVRGHQDGPVLGITAAVHGNEINGIPTIHRLVESISIKDLHGTIIAIPIMNVPGYLAYSREFIDGVDLNRIMPGAKFGTPSEIYAHNFTERVLRHFTHHLDLHTASFGRVNSHYIRADLNDDDVRELAKIQHADIILHTTGPASSVRQTAMNLNIPSITIELGNPQVFQPHFVSNAITSIRNIMKKLGMITGEIILPETTPVVCNSSYWTRVNDGGILQIPHELTKRVYKDELMASLYDIYGRLDIEYLVPEDGIIIGKSVNPVVSTGDRIIHLGIVEESGFD